MRLTGFQKLSHGITMIELIIAVTVLGIAAALTTSGVRFINDIVRQNTSMEIQREGQLALHRISQDVRNAYQITALSSETHKLVLSVYDVSQGYDITLNPNLFTNFGSISYEFVQSASEGTYLLRKTDFGGKINEKKMLRNMLLPDDPETPVVETIFFPYPSTATGPEFDATTIRLRLATGLMKDRPKSYQAISMVRAFQGS